MLDRTIQDLALARLGAVGEEGDDGSGVGLADAVAGSVGSYERDTAGRATGSEGGDGLAQALEVGVQVFAVAAFDCCVRDALAFAAAVGGVLGVGNCWVGCLGGLVGFGGDEIVVAVVATGGFDVRGFAGPAMVVAFDGLGLGTTWHAWAIDTHVVGMFLMRTGDRRMGVWVPGVAWELGRLQVSRSRLIRDERFDRLLW